MYLAQKPADPNLLVAFIYEWLDTLYKRDYSKASSLLYQGGEWTWDADQLGSAIESDNYGIEERGHYKVTPYETAHGENPREFYDDLVSPGDNCYLHPKWPIKIVFWGESSIERPSVIGRAEINYALNGKWTDVYSAFFIHEFPNGVAFELRSTEVM